MNSREILQEALASQLIDEGGQPVELELIPAVTPAELQELSSQLPCEIPAQVQDLLGFCRGFYGSAADVVDFTGRECAFEHAEIFPQGLPIASDGFGNFWVADLSSKSNDWSPVFFACHDPPIVLFQSASLADFLRGLLDLLKPPHRSIVDDVHEDRLFEVWRKNPEVLPQERCVDSTDRDLAAFAGQLDGTWSIVDLRQPKIGFGFSWGRYGPKTEIRRFGSVPIFAYRRPPGVLRRLLGRM